MMPTPKMLLRRLDAIATSFSLIEGSLALLANGSVGLERERLDRYSDLDFLAVVATGYKHPLLDDLNWLARVEPLTFRFRNTPDGFKLLFADGIFAEMAVFEIDEFPAVPRSQSRIVWADDAFDPLLSRAHGARPPERTAEWRLGEALTNLYVGLGRFRRGEKLSAMRFVQGYALDRVVELLELTAFEIPIDVDPFDPARRLESRFPDLGERLARMAQGYERTPESAAEILFFLEDHFPVNDAIAREIRRLLHDEGVHGSDS